MKHTSVWINPATNHQYEEGPRGNLLNGKPCARPDWVEFVRPREYSEIIDWSGGDCPLDEGADVRCFFRDRLPYVGAAIFSGLSAKAASSMWQHAPHGLRTDPRFDIVAYQVGL